MAKPNHRLTELTAYELGQLRLRADKLTRLDHFLSHLPLGLQAEYLSDEELECLYQIARDPERALSGSLLLTWYNACRARSNITHRK